MLNITFNRSHLSITNFPPIAIPDFTIITGPNGAGKTHFLQALQQGHLKTDLAPEQEPHNQSQIRLFDWSTMVPQDTGYFTSETIRNERANLFTNFNNWRNAHGWIEPARNVARSFSFDQEYITDPTKILELPDAEMSARIGEQNVEQVRQQLRDALGGYENNVLNNLDETSRAQIRALARFSKKSIISLTEKDVLSPAVPTWGQSDLFQQSFARLFVAYRDLLLANTLAQYRASKGHDAIFLSDEQFVEIHGPAPWDFVNSSLKEANLDFSINSPSLDDYQQFQPTLRKTSSGVEIPFSALSSGEKVLMSFAFCVYYSNDRRQLSVQPKILLLDEIDAPLHPSMSKNVIQTITKTLVSEFGIRVIATTHSPSTIAMASDECIYTMQPGKPGLFKTTKADALNILTVGVPTLAISYDGRRQVFVESPIDAKIYDLLYKQLKTRILSERSLEFVATGSRVPGKGDQNTGCDVVKRLVQELSSAGNISVFGLLDWDGKHNSSERVAVLAEGRRNGLENVLLDPLLIGILVCRAFPERRGEIGLTQDDTYLKLVSADQVKLQALGSKIAEIIFSSKPTSTQVSRYGGSLELDFDERCFSTDDHTYEDMILKAFPFLNAIAKNQSGNLLEYMINNVLGDSPSLIPQDAEDVIRNLLAKPSH